MSGAAILGLPQNRTSLSAPSALARARVMLGLAQSGAVDLADGSAFDVDEPDDADNDIAGRPSAAYLLSRDRALMPPTGVVLPTLAAFMATSRVLSEVLPGLRDVRAASPTAMDPVVAAVVREVIAERLSAAAARTSGLPTSLLDRLRTLAEVLGIEFVKTIKGASARCAGSIGGRGAGGLSRRHSGVTS